MQNVTRLTFPSHILVGLALLIAAVCGSAWSETLLKEIRCPDEDTTAVDTTNFGKVVLLSESYLVASGATYDDGWRATFYVFSAGTGSYLRKVVMPHWWYSAAICLDDLLAVGGDEGTTVTFFSLSDGSAPYRLVRPEVFPAQSETPMFGTALLWHGGSLYVSDPTAVNIAKPDRLGVVWKFDLAGGASTLYVRQPADNNPAYFATRMFPAGDSVLLQCGAPAQSAGKQLAASNFYLGSRKGKLSRNIGGREVALGFGCDAASDGKAVYISDTYDDSGLPGMGGSVLCYNKAGKLRKEIADTASTQTLGVSVKLADKELLVSSSSFTSTGSIRVFDCKKRSLLRSIENPNPATVHFGGYIAVSDTRLAANAKVAGLYTAGIVYLFERGND